MRVLIATIGSDGDVQPFCALARRLMAAGHEVRLAIGDRFADRAASLGIPFTIVGRPWNDAEKHALSRRVLAEKQPLKQLASIIDSIIEPQRAVVPAMKELASGADVVVYPPLFVAAVAAARAVGARHVSAHFGPLHRAESYGPTGANLGRFANRLLWSLAGAMFRRATDARLNRVVEAAGLPPWRDVMLSASHSKLLDLVAVSPRIIPKDPSWGEETRVTGYWFLDEEAKPDDALAAFVAEEPPVVVGFGSMTGIDARRVTACIVEAVKGLGRRVVVQSGWAGLGADDLPKHVHVAPFVPHAWLFPRAACVVHHGGAGTTGAAFRAGVPQAVVWHLGDQPMWGRKIAEHGVGPAPRSHRQLDAAWLRGAIERMLADGEMRERAKTLGAAIRGEDGLGAAVSAIEDAASRA